MELSEIIHKNIKIHAKSEYPNECCGLIVKLNNETISVPCENTSKTPEKSFIIDHQEIQKYNSNDIIGFYHSHKDLLDFSLADIAFSEKLNKFCVLYVVDSNILKIHKPNGVEIPYVGRPFFLGTLDCFVLFKDYYRRVLNINITLPEIDHPQRYNVDYWKSKEAEIEFAKLGSPKWINNFLIDNNFTEVKDLKKYDILVFKLPMFKFECHVGIYLENHQILHHLSEFSAIENYKHAYKRATTHIFRHKTLI